MATQKEIMDLIKEQQYANMKQKMLSRNMVYANPNWQSEMAKLTPEQEQQFVKWVESNKIPFNIKDKYPDYDMRGYWLSLQDPKAAKSAVNKFTGTLHFPDIYKTPYHESFSKESKWATDKAPSWKDNKLVLPNGTVVFEDKPGK
jgi:hypothetical protein